MEFQATPKHHFPEYKQGETRIDVFLGDLFKRKSEISEKQLYPVL